MAVIVAVFVVVAMLLMAFVVDRGSVYVERTQLQNSVDAASLAAVQATCGNPASTPEQVRQIAIDYGTANGVSINPADIVVQDGPNDFTTGVSVAAQRAVSSLFGGFAGVAEATVAARATATRICTETFQYVADVDATFNGTSGADVAGNFYAGRCFDGRGGLYSGLIAVSQSDGYTGCNPPGDWPIFNGNLQENGTNCPDDIGGCAYDVSNVSMESAILAAGYVISTIDALPLGSPSDCGDVDTQAEFDAGVVCEGDLDVPVGISITNDVIVRGGDYNDKSSTAYLSASKVLIYSDTGRILINTNVGVDPTFTFYAPTPTGGPQSSVVFGGGGADMDGTIIGHDIELNGGGSTGGGGTQIRIAGPWRLSQ